MATYKALNNLKLDNSPVKNLGELSKGVTKYNESNLIGITTQTSHTLAIDFNVDGATHNVVYKGFCVPTSETSCSSYFMKAIIC